MSRKASLTEMIGQQVSESLDQFRNGGSTVPSRLVRSGQGIRKLSAEHNVSLRDIWENSLHQGESKKHLDPRCIIPERLHPIPPRPLVPPPQSADANIDSSSEEEQERSRIGRQSLSDAFQGMLDGNVPSTPAPGIPKLDYLSVESIEEPDAGSMSCENSVSQSAPADLLNEGDLLEIILKIGQDCFTHLAAFESQAIKPLLKSGSIGGVDILIEEHHEFEFDVQAAIMPVINLSAFLKAFSAVTAYTEEDKLVHAVGMLSMGHFSKSLELFSQSYSKLEYLISKVAPSVSLVEPIRLFRELSTMLELLSTLPTPSFSKERNAALSQSSWATSLQNQSDIGWSDIATAVSSCLIEVMSKESWTSLSRKPMLEINRAITQSASRGLIPDVLDPSCHFLFKGTFIRHEKNRLRVRRARQYHYYLFTTFLLWVHPKKNAYKDHFVLSKNCRVSKSTLKNGQFVAKLKAPIEVTGIPKMEFVFTEEHARNAFVYLMYRSIQNVTLREHEAFRRVSHKSRRSMFASQHKTDVSVPFNVHKTVVMNFEMEWQGNPEDSFSVLSKIGSGGFGSVYKVKHSSSNFTMAAKLVDASSEQQLRKEIDLLKRCSHPNIVSFYGIAGPDSKGMLWILMDFCAAGSISDIYRKLQSFESQPFTEDQIGFMLSKLTLALIYLHQRDIVHRDVKAANILLSEQGEVRLADFGVSKQFGNPNMSATKGIVGSPYWMPPEALDDEAKENLGGKATELGCRGDIWSLGITAFELATGHPPFYEMSPIQAMMRIANKDPEPLPAPWSDTFRDFICTCLIRDPLERPNAAEVLQHPFIMRHLRETDSRKLLPVILRLGLVKVQTDTPTVVVDKEEACRKTKVLEELRDRKPSNRKESDDISFDSNDSFE